MERREADIKAGKAVATSGCEVFEFGPKLVIEEEEEAGGTCYIQGTGGKGDDSMSVNDTDLSLRIPRDVEEIGTSVAVLKDKHTLQGKMQSKGNVRRSGGNGGRGDGEDNGEETRKWVQNNPRVNSVDNRQHHLFCHLESTGRLLPHEGSGGRLSPVSLPTLTASHSEFRVVDKLKMATRRWL